MYIGPISQVKAELPNSFLYSHGNNFVTARIWGAVWPWVSDMANSWGTTYFFKKKEKFFLKTQFALLWHTSIGQEYLLYAWWGFLQVLYKIHCHLPTNCLEYLFHSLSIGFDLFPLPSTEYFNMFITQQPSSFSFCSSHHKLPTVFFFWWQFLYTVYDWQQVK